MEVLWLILMLSSNRSPHLVALLLETRPLHQFASQVP